MRKITFFIALIMASIFLSIFAYASENNFMINSYYAIESAKEYNNIKGFLVGNSNHMYFQWARIALNSEGKLQFTNKYNIGISEYDERNLEYGLPHNVLEGYTNKIDYKDSFPKGQAFLSVFFENYFFDINKNSSIEFLNMTEKEWEELIIKPMVEMLNGYYEDNYYTECEFDGLVLDFEGFRDEIDNINYTQNEKTELKEKYNKFLEHLKRFINDKELIVCIHPTNVEGYYDGYDYEYINQIADYIILMAYNYQDAIEYSNLDNITDDITEPVYERVFCNETQPYDKVKDAAYKIINDHNVDPHKLILGLDLAGMKWIKLSKSIDNEIKYYYLLRRPDIDGIEEAVDTEGIYIEDTRTYKKVLLDDGILEKDRQKYEKYGFKIENVEYYYETPESINNKYYEILYEYNIAGLSIWRIGTGSNDVWRSLGEICYNNEIKIWDERTDVPPDKEWKIKLTIPVDYYTVNNQNIYVTDKYGNKVEVVVELNMEDSKIVTVTPLKNYVNGEAYYLYITKGLKSTNGRELINGVIIKFTIISR